MGDLFVPEILVYRSKMRTKQGTDLIIASLLFKKTNIDAKVSKYWYTVLRKSRRKFSGSLVWEWTILPSITKFATWKRHKFWTANRSYYQQKTLLEIFATFNSSIVLLATQVNRKIESDIEFSGRCDQVTLRVYSETKYISVLNDGKLPGFCFC